MPAGWCRRERTGWARARAWRSSPASAPSQAPSTEMGRFVVIVIDSLGAGELPDAKAYGDAGANTVANCARKVGGLAVPNLQAWGLGNITAIPGCPPAHAPRAAFGRMAELSEGKDTTTGHWEMMGAVL